MTLIASPFAPDSLYASDAAPEIASDAQVRELMYYFGRVQQVYLRDQYATRIAAVKTAIYAEAEDRNGNVWRGENVNYFLYRAGQKDLTKAGASILIARLAAMVAR